MSTVIFSLNLQNYYGDRDSRTPNEKLGRSQSQVLARLVALKSARQSVEVICTQEDKDGLLIPGFTEGVAACTTENRPYEAVRIYVRDDLVVRAKFETHQLKPRHCEYYHIPERCAVAVEIQGFRIVNVFYPGGRYDDSGMFHAKEKCERELRGLRKKFTREILRKLAPDVIVGDWNASIEKEAEEKVFTVRNTFVQNLAWPLVDAADIQRKLTSWLAWRNSPFPVLERRGYAPLWPAERTTSRVDLAVDGFFYLKERVEAVGFVKVDAELLRDSDHAAIIGTFKVKSETSSPSTLRPDWRGARELEQLQEVHDLALRPGAPLLGKFLFRAARQSFERNEVRDRRNLDQGRYEMEAATHIYRTHYHAAQNPQTAFMSFSLTLTAAMTYAEGHPGFDYIWVLCVNGATDARDASTRRGSKKLSDVFLGSDLTDEILQGESELVPVSWARWKNFWSGIVFSQVLVGRNSLSQSTVISLPVAAISKEARKVNWAQDALMHRHLSAIASEKKFYMNELLLRRLVIPDYDRLRKDCSEHSRGFFFLCGGRIL